MNQTGYISFLLLAAFAVFITVKGEAPIYASFFLTSGNDPLAPGNTSGNQPTVLPDTGGSSPSQITGQATSLVQTASSVASITALFA